MITDGLSYLALLLFVASSIVLIEHHTRWRLFSYLPSIVLIYLAVMLLSTWGLWQKNEAITHTYQELKSLLLPAMIFLMLLQADIRQIIRLGKKMLFAFFLASVSIALGFVVMYGLMHPYFDAHSWKAFAALSGSWMGGTGNMVAIQGALHLPDSKMGYTLLIDSVDYAIWVMILLALVPFAKVFNRWSGADTSMIDQIGQKLASQESSSDIPSFASLFFLLGSAMVVAASSHWAAHFMPTVDFFSQSTWVVIIATILGILMAMTPLARLPGTQILGNMMLYLIVALIASRASFSELTQAPLYILAGFVIIMIHAVLMALFAKLFKLDLFTLGIASLANIGGVASAPILASAYSKSLIPIGILMAMLGYIIGTFGGLMVGRVLAMIAH